MATKKKRTTKKKATQRITTKTAKRPTKKSISKPQTQGTCFVMMPFKDPFGGYYDTVFKPAITKAKLAPVRADDLFRPGVIVSDLWQMIQEAKILLAELTTKNANVFYELGLAHAIGKPVILVCENLDDVPFDLQQLRILIYDKNNPEWGKELSEKITRAIAETLDKPIEAVPSVFRKKVPSQAPKQDELTSRLDVLENQVRSIRFKGDINRRSFNLMEEELMSVFNSSELDKWLRKWFKRGVNIVDLLEMVKDASNISMREKKRIGSEFGDILSGLLLRS